MKKTYRILLMLLALLLLCSFYIFSRQVKRGFLKQTDFNVTVRIQDKIPKRFDEMWEDVAFFVTPGPSVVIILFITAIAIIKGKTWKRRLVAMTIPLFFGLLIFGEIYGKSVVHHPAPPFFMIKNPTTIFPTYYINEQYSYPSGHTARAVFLGCILYPLFTMYYVQKQISKVLLALGIMGYIGMVAVGRMYLGHHWLSDVLGGFFLGGGLGLLTAGAISPIITK